MEDSFRASKHRRQSQPLTKPELKEGRILRVIKSATDSPSSSLKPDTKHDVFPVRRRHSCWKEKVTVSKISACDSRQRHAEIRGCVTLPCAALFSQFRIWARNWGTSSERDRWVTDAQKHPVSATLALGFGTRRFFPISLSLPSSFIFIPSQVSAREGGQISPSAEFDAGKNFAFLS